MNEISIRDSLRNWSQDDLTNLQKILEIDTSDDDKALSIESALKWLYHSKMRAGVQQVGKDTKNYLMSHINRSDFSATDKDDVYSTPSYSDIVLKCSQKLKVNVSDDTAVLEMYLAEYVIANSLANMTPSERHLFLNKEIDPKSMFEHAGIENDSLNGMRNTMAILSIANAAGFGLYTTATTALHLTISSIGLALPFAAYSGLSTLLATAIGPVGWISAGVWGMVKMTNPEIKELVPAVLYISSVNSKLKWSK